MFGCLRGRGRGRERKWVMEMKRKGKGKDGFLPLICLDEGKKEMEKRERFLFFMFGLAYGRE